MPPGVVLDASAALAVVLGEPGGEQAFESFPGAVISAVNWGEVIQRALGLGLETALLRDDFEGMGVRVVPAEAAHAEHAAGLQAATRSLGLSLADRMCLALGAALGSPVLTADRAWADLDLGVEVRLIR